MLYAIVVLVILVIILLVFLGRFASNQAQRSRLRAQQERARRDPESHPPDILTRELAPRPTLTGVANEISGRWLNGDRPRNGEAYDPIQRRSQDTYYGASSVYRDRTGNGGGVTREGVEQDAELPSYNDRSTIPIPQAAYSSPIQARHDTRNSNDTFIQPPASHPTDQPPKYDSPIVRQL